MPQSILALYFIIIWPLTLRVNGFGKIQATKGLNGLCESLFVSLCGGPSGGAHIGRKLFQSLAQKRTCTYSKMLGGR